MLKRNQMPNPKRQRNQWLEKAHETRVLALQLHGETCRYAHNCNISQYQNLPKVSKGNLYVLVLYARWCRCAVSEFLLKIIQRLGRKPCYPHASCYYCIAAHKVIHTVFYCIAEARFSRRNPSSLLLCVTIRLVLQNDTYSPTFTFLSMVNYSTIKPLNMPIHHT